MTKEQLIQKFTSRKFWLAVAAMFGSIGASITGLQSGSENLAAFGIFASVVSAAIYAAAEAYVDAARIASQQEDDE